MATTWQISVDAIGWFAAQSAWTTFRTRAQSLRAWITTEKIAVTLAAKTIGLCGKSGIDGTSAIASADADHVGAEIVPFLTERLPAVPRAREKFRTN
jgi:hypothetical protein